MVIDAVQQFSPARLNPQTDAQPKTKNGNLMVSSEIDESARNTQEGDCVKGSPKMSRKFIAGNLVLRF